MSLVRKYLLTNFSYMNLASSCYFIKDIRPNSAQYYTCSNNSANIQSGLFKYRRLDVDNRRDMSVVQTLRESNFNVAMKVKNFADNIPTYLPFFGQKYRKLGYYWFKTLDEIKTEDFFKFLKLPDTFYSRFQIIELHVWMLMYHLPKEGRVNRFIRLGVIQAMWEDSQKRAKLVADINVNYKKNFRGLYGEFLFSQLLYDYCFSQSDTALASAVWCNFFNKEDVDPRILEAAVSYIRFQMHHLNKLNFRELNMKEEKCGIWAPVGPHLEEVLKKS